MSSHAHIALDRLIRAGRDLRRVRSRMPFAPAAATLPRWAPRPMTRVDHAVAIALHAALTGSHAVTAATHVLMATAVCFAALGLAAAAHH